MKEVNLGRISFLRICQECYQAENKGQSDDASESYVKKKYQHFANLLDELQIDPSNLKDTTGHYSFCKEHKPILQDILLKYTDKDFKEIRRGTYLTEHSRVFIENMQKIIQDCMQASGKDAKKIEEQLSAFYTAVEADKIVSLANFQTRVKDSLDSFYEKSLGSLLLRRSDKILLLESLYKDFEIAINAIWDAYSYIASELAEFRSEEIGDAGVATQHSLERHKLVNASFLWDEKICDDTELVALYKQLEECPSGKLANQNKQHSIWVNIQRRKDFLCEQTATQYGITAEDIKQFRTEEQLAESVPLLTEALERIGLNALPYLTKDCLDCLFPYPTHPKINMTQEGCAQIEEYIQQEQQRRGLSLQNTETIAASLAKPRKN